MHFNWYHVKALAILLCGAFLLQACSVYENKAYGRYKNLATKPRSVSDCEEVYAVVKSSDRFKSGRKFLLISTAECFDNYGQEDQAEEVYAIVREISPPAQKDWYMTKRKRAEANRKRDQERFQTGNVEYCIEDKSHRDRPVPSGNTFVYSRNVTSYTNNCTRPVWVVECWNPNKGSPKFECMTEEYKPQQRRASTLSLGNIFIAQKRVFATQESADAFAQEMKNR
ncbi:MAG: hypothetical protein AB7P50_11150 [Alphaproteobacteria bacterium]